MFSRDCQSYHPVLSITIRGSDGQAHHVYHLSRLFCRKESFTCCHTMNFPQKFPPVPSGKLYWRSKNIACCTMHMTDCRSDSWAFSVHHPYRTVHSIARTARTTVQTHCCIVYALAAAALLMVLLVSTFLSLQGAGAPTVCTACSGCSKTRYIHRLTVDTGHRPYPVLFLWGERQPHYWRGRTMTVTH